MHGIGHRLSGECGRSGFCPAVWKDKQDVLFQSMQLHLLKSKIHRAQVTGASINYEGSLTVAVDLMEKVGLLPFERILCSNLANGQRFETYAIPGERCSGAIVLNGATAHLGKAGDRLTIMSYAIVDERETLGWTPRIIVLGERNTIINERGI